jgi:membrane protein YdbS with pleckstrin-like domain
MTKGVPANRVFYRFKLTNFSVWLITAFAALYFLTELVKELGEKEAQPATIILTALLMVAFLVPAVRYPWHGVVATTKEIKVRNILKTHVVRWSEIDRFELTRHNPWPRVGVVALKSGKNIPMTGIQAVPYERSPITKFAMKTVAALNEQLTAVSSQGIESSDYPSERQQPQSADSSSNPA